MNQWMQIIKETSVGTTPAADANNSIWIDLEETDPQINLVPNMYTIRTALPQRGVTDRISGSGSDNIDGSLTVKLYHEQANFWNEAVWEPTIVSTHYTTLPTYTITRGWIDDTYTARIEQYKRCIFTGCTINGSNADGADPITMDLTIMGGEYNSGATLTAPACTVFPTELYLWPMTDFYLDNTDLTSVIRSVGLTISHNITKIRHMNRYPTRYKHGGWNKSFNVTMDMASHAYRTKYLSIRSSFASAIYADDNYLEFIYAADKKIKFEFFNAMFESLDPQRPMTFDHTQSGVIKPHYDCTNFDMTCTITNPA